MSIFIKGANTGTATEAEGNYKLAVSDTNSILAYSFIGYVTREKYKPQMSALKNKLTAYQCKTKDPGETDNGDYPESSPGLNDQIRGFS